MDGRFDCGLRAHLLLRDRPAQRDDYVKASLGCSRPAADFLAIFFLDPDNDGEGPPYPVGRKELEDRFGRHFALEREWIPAHTHPGREGRELMRTLVKT